MTLLELVACVALLGVFAAVAVSRSDGLFADAAARRTCDEFAGLLHLAHRRAVLTGDVHGVAFERSGGVVVRGQLARWDAAGVRTDLDAAVDVPAGVTVSSPTAPARVDWEGVPLDGGVSVQFAGPRRTWQIWRPPLTGALRINEL